MLFSSRLTKLACILAIPSMANQELPPDFPSEDYSDEVEVDASREVRYAACRLESYDDNDVYGLVRLT